VLHNLRIGPVEQHKTFVCRQQCTVQTGSKPRKVWKNKNYKINTRFDQSVGKTSVHKFRISSQIPCDSGIKEDGLRCG